MLLKKGEIDANECKDEDIFIGWRILYRRSWKLIITDESSGADFLNALRRAM